MTLATAEAAVRNLELMVTRRLDGLLQGDHQGLVPAAGSEPADSREYQPGDDVRHMDWSLTARSHTPHVSATIADRELETWLVVDGSASLDFGTATCEKRDLALAAAATFAFLTTRDGNRVGAVIVGPQGSTVVPPRSGRPATLSLLHRLVRRPRAELGEVSLAEALRQVRTTARRRGLVVVITDLLDTGPWQRELRALSLRQELVVAEIRDPREDQLPAVGLLTLVDPETGRRVEVQTSNRRLRTRFEAAALDRRRATERSVRSSGATHLVLSTDRDWTLDVVRFVAGRRRRR